MEGRTCSAVRCWGRASVSVADKMEKGEKATNLALASFSDDPSPSCLCSSPIVYSHLNPPPASLVSFVSSLFLYRFEQKLCSRIAQ